MKTLGDKSNREREYNKDSFVKKSVYKIINGGDHSHAVNWNVDQRCQHRNLYIYGKEHVHFLNVILRNTLCLPIGCHINVILIGHEGDLLRI